MPGQSINVVVEPAETFEPLAKTAWIRESEGLAHFWVPRAASSRTESLKQFRHRGVHALTSAFLFIYELFACLYS